VEPIVEPNPRFGPKVKNGRSRAGEAQLRDNPVGGELDPADNARRRCKKNAPSVGQQTPKGFIIKIYNLGGDVLLSPSWLCY